MRRQTSYDSRRQLFSYNLDNENILLREKIINNNGNNLTLMYETPQYNKMPRNYDLRAHDATLSDVPTFYW